MPAWLASSNDSTGVRHFFIALAPILVFARHPGVTRAVRRLGQAHPAMHAFGPQYVSRTCHRSRSREHEFTPDRGSFSRIREVRAWDEALAGEASGPATRNLSNSDWQIKGSTTLRRTFQCKKRTPAPSLHNTAHAA